MKKPVWLTFNIAAQFQSESINLIIKVNEPKLQLTWNTKNVLFTKISSHLRNKFTLRVIPSLSIPLTFKKSSSVWYYSQLWIVKIFPLPIFPRTRNVLTNVMFIFRRLKEPHGFHGSMSCICYQLYLIRCSSCL